MKTSGSYASLVQGVSQQVPHERGPGQCSEQVNLIPDPVLGLTRRHGSILQSETVLTLDVGALAAITADTASWRTLEYNNAGYDFEVMYRTGACPVGSPLPAARVYNRTTKTFLDTVTLPIGGDPTMDLLRSGGVSAITSVGKYVFMAGHTVPTTATSDNKWNSAANRNHSVVWVRGGAYARTFRVTASLTGGGSWTFEYTTPTSSYPGTLDTSTVPIYAAVQPPGASVDSEGAYITARTGTYAAGAKLGWAAWSPSALTAYKAGVAMTNVWPAAPTTPTQYAYATPNGEVYFAASNIGALDVTMTYTHVSTVTNPNYAKQVADLTNAYNTAVTQWIGTSATAIQPENIAESLRLAAVAAGLTGGYIVDSTLIFDNIDTLSVSDGGDGTLIRGVANDVTAADQMSTIHMVGKLVRVRAKNSQEAYYLKALSKDDSVAAGLYGEVLWVEDAGTISTITGGLIYGTAVGTNFYMASSPQLLALLTPGPHPDYVPSTAGDLESVPLPYFVGRKITFLTTFQDRLVIGSGGVMRCSKSGDYLNLFRSSILTVPEDDPFEMLSQSSDDDELRFPVLYDRDLVAFAKKRQYVVSGRTKLTPLSANMAVMSSHADASDLPPLAAGGLIFYGKLDQGGSSVHQIQPGLVADSPESYLASSQLDDFMPGSAIELSKNAKPAILFVRTTGARNSIFTFQYLDTQAGRKQDAWSRWDFNPDLGPIIGMQGTAEGLLVFTVRESFGALWLVADLVPTLSQLSHTPYLDSQRPWSVVDAGSGSVRPDSPGDWKVAFDDSSEFKFIGGDLADAAELFAAWPAATGPVVGMDMSAWIAPTNPVVRDRNGEAITTAPLTVTRFVASMAKSSGYDTEIVSQVGTRENTFNGRVLGDPNNLIGRIPVTAYQTSIPVGENSNKFLLRIKARSWLPFTLTALEWVGQYFNRTRRF